MLLIGLSLQVPVSENTKLMSFGTSHHYLECIKAAYDFASNELLNLINEKVSVTNGFCFSFFFLVFLGLIFSVSLSS